MPKEYHSQYYPADGVDDEDAKLLDSGTETRPPKFRFLQGRLRPWLSYGVLMSITMLFFTLWARGPSIDAMVLYCRWTDGVNAQDVTYPSQLLQTRL